MRDIFLDREDKGIPFVTIKNVTSASSLLRSAAALSRYISSITRSGARFTISGGSVASDLSKNTSMLIVHPCQPWRIRGQQHADRHRYDAALIRLPFLWPQLIIAWARQNQSRTNSPLDNPRLVSIFPGPSNSWHSAVLKQPGCPTPEGTCGINVEASIHPSVDASGTFMLSFVRLAAYCAEAHPSAWPEELARQLTAPGRCSMSCIRSLTNS